jgi:hypothetical protein
MPGKKNSVEKNTINLEKVEKPIIVKMVIPVEPERETSDLMTRKGDNKHSFM